MNEPIGVDLRGQPFLELKLLGQLEAAAEGQRLDSEDALTQKRSDDRRCGVGRTVVDDTCLDAFLVKVPEATGDVVFLVPHGENGNDTHTLPQHKA